MPTKRKLRPFKPGERRDNPDGSHSTEITTTWQLPDGQWVNAPSLWMGDDGNPVQFDEGDEQGILGTLGEWEAGGGKPFQRFPSLEEAENAARARSEAGGVESTMNLGGLGRLITGGGGLGAPQPQTGGLGGFMGNAMGGLSRFNENHPGLLMAGGLALQGENIWPAAMYGSQVRKTKKEEADLKRKEGMTRDYLIRKGLSPEDADAVIASGQAGSYMKAPKDGSDVTYGLNPIWGKDENGNDVLGVLGNDGSFKPIDTGGFDPSRGLEKVDLGTAWGFRDKGTGQIVHTEPKDIAGVEEQKEIGKGKGEASASLASIESKLPGLEATVGELDSLAEKATYTLGGQGLDWFNRQAGIEPRDAAVARQQYIATVSNQILPLLRDTFGAQFTAREGDVLMATLGNPDLAPKEKQAVLRAFIAQKKRDVAALRSRTGDSAPAGGNQRLRYNPNTGELE